MKLTTTQKQDLYLALVTFFNTHKDDDTMFTSKELAQAINMDFNVSPISIAAALRNREKQETSNYQIIEGSPIKYQSYNTNRIIHITGMNKDKNLLFFTNTENKKLAYNFNTKEMESDIYNPVIKSDDFELADLYNFIHAQGYRLKEWVFSYLDLLPRVNFSNLLSIQFDCPKGYINFIKKYEYKINNSSYDLFNFIVKNAKGNEDIGIKYYNIIYNTGHYLGENDKKYLKNNLEVITKFYKCLKVDINNFNPINRVENDFLEFVRYLQRLDDINLIDTNRGVKANLQRFKAHFEQVQNELLTKN